MSNLQVGALVVIAIVVIWFFLYVRGRKRGVLGRFVLDRSETFPDGSVITKSVQPGASQNRVMVALTNPDHKTDLIALASTLARQHENAVVVAVHIVGVPYHTSLDVDGGESPSADSQGTNIRVGPAG